MDRVAVGFHDLVLDHRFDPLRAAALAHARGRVLEIGAGTGLNFGFYAPDTDVYAIEPARPLRARALARAHDAAVRARVEVAYGRAEELAFDAASFDAVVFTFVLCSIADVAAALREARRVLRPDGALIVAEHVLSSDPRVARWQRRVQPVWRHVFSGCSLVHDTRADLARAGFDTRDVRDVRLPLPRLARAGLVGVARPLDG